MAVWAGRAPRGLCGAGRPGSTAAPHGGLRAAGAAGAAALPAVRSAVPLRHLSGLFLTARDRPPGGEVAGDPAAAGGEVRAASSSSFSFSSCQPPPCPGCLLGNRRAEGLPPFPSPEREGGLAEGAGSVSLWRRVC